MLPPGPRESRHCARPRRNSGGPRHPSRWVAGRLVAVASSERDAPSRPEEPVNPYAAAGVDTAAGDLAVELMKSAVRRTHGPEVLGGVGGFAGLFDAAAFKA